MNLHFLAEDLDDGYLERGVHERYEQGKLNQQYKWHSIDKIPVPRFMTKSIHSNNGTYASADYCNDKKGCFRYPEGPFFRFVFINAHQYKSDEIQYCKVY